MSYFNNISNHAILEWKMNNILSKKHASSILLIVLLLINCASTSKPIVNLTMISKAIGLRNLEPMDLEYPEWALEERVEGITEVTVMIGRDGTVIDSRILQTSGNDRLDSAALHAARGIRIRIHGPDPSRQDFGWHSVRIRYKL